MEHERGRVGHVAGHEWDALLHQGRDEPDIASLTIEASDQQRRAGLAAAVHRCAQLRPVAVLAAFHLREGRQQQLVVGFQECGDGGLLRLKAEAAAALSVDRR
jgi:hypothetical protein